MHVLHRPQIHRAIAVTLIAAALAIVLTLAIASRLSDQNLAPSSPSVAAAGVPASANGPRPETTPFMRSPFASLLITPVPEPWAHHAGLAPEQ
jgi:hypothetical protein